jgi:chromate transport protein ChrA
MLFFAYAHVSPYALRIQSMSIASFVPGVLATSLGFFLVATVCYLPSPGALLVASSSVLCSIFAIVFARTYVKRTQETWFVQGSGRTYTIAVIVFIASLFVIGIITSSFGI